MGWFKASKSVDQVEIAAQIRSAFGRIQQLEEALASLQDKHERLRGKFYATRQSDSPPPQESKAEILRRMGFLGRTPGS